MHQMETQGLTVHSGLLFCYFLNFYYFYIALFFSLAFANDTAKHLYKFSDNSEAVSIILLKTVLLLRLDKYSTLRIYVNKRLKQIIVDTRRRKK